jgi:DNA-binding response OmpR family regulator
VLIVDDEPKIGKIFGLKLKLAGYDIVISASGAEAIELIRKGQLDIVLLDILMPVVTGFDVLNEVRIFSEVPIIVFTANLEATSLAMKLGANDFVMKPSDPNELEKKIKIVLDTAKQTTCVPV